MAKIKYQDINFKPSSLDLIAKANEILAEYDMDLTLRQLYYQFVSRDYLPNTSTSYDRLGKVINDARLAGLIDWDRIQDLTRELRGTGVWNTPGEIIGAAARQYRYDTWKTQKHRPEVWVEKDALRTVIERAVSPLNLPFFACRGYVSQSEMWEAAQRMLRWQKAGQQPVIIHLGDHDPSGIDMTRDIKERLALFRAEPIVKRIALNMDQVRAYAPPPNPAKTTDCRFATYKAVYGDESWELDALEPSVLIEMIQAEIGKLTDKGKMTESEEIQRKHRYLLATTSRHWEEVSDFVDDNWPEERGDADDEETDEEVDEDEEDDGGNAEE